MFDNSGALLVEHQTPQGVDDPFDTIIANLRDKEDSLIVTKTLSGKVQLYKLKANDLFFQLIFLMELKQDATAVETQPISGSQMIIIADNSGVLRYFYQFKGVLRFKFF